MLIYAWAKYTCPTGWLRPMAEHTHTGRSAGEATPVTRTCPLPSATSAPAAPWRAQQLPEPELGLIKLLHQFPGEIGQAADDDLGLS